MLPHNYNHIAPRFTPPAVIHPGLLAEDVVVPHYPDNGCTFSPSCLACALYKCAYDMDRAELARLRSSLNHQPSKDQASKDQALASAVQDLLCRGITKLEAVQMVAKREGMSARTIFRRLAPRAVR